MKKCQKACLRHFLLPALYCGIFAAIFALYGLPLKAVAYPGLLCALLTAGWLWADRRAQQRRLRHLDRLSALPDDLIDRLREFDAPQDLAWRTIIENLSHREKEAIETMLRRDSDRLDYYTTWVHQIKIPIAAAHLALQNEDSPLSRTLEAQLQRIEQYAQMALTYQRLDDVNTDYVFREYALDALIKSAIRKFAGQFIQKGIRLEYTPVPDRVITDEKWLCFVLEQLLSNALKYTPKGTVSIGMEDGCLCIRDTGIGIDPADLPRIFDRGYTGLNGRTDTRATGLGLYLCRRICQKLGHGISAQSEPGQGTVIRLDLRRENCIFE